MLAIDDKDLGTPKRASAKTVTLEVDGREVTVPDVETIAGQLYQAAEGKQMPLTQWVGLRE